MAHSAAHYSREAPKSFLHVSPLELPREDGAKKPARGQSGRQGRERSFGKTTEGGASCPARQVPGPLPPADERLPALPHCTLPHAGERGSSPFHKVVCANSALALFALGVWEEGGERAWWEELGRVLHFCLRDRLQRALY